MILSFHNNGEITPSKNNMANQLPTQEFVYTGEGVIPHDVTHVEFVPGVIGFVGSVAFRDCRDSLRVVVLNEGLETIGSDTFSGCSSLESLTVPSTAMSICSYAFANCSSLREVVLNVGLKTIESYAFSYCSSLERLAFPSTAMSICSYAFHGCSSLREVVLNEGNQMKRIESYAFSGSSLESITFPSTAIIICSDAFNGCSMLREVVLNEGIQTIGRDAFSGSSLESLRFADLSESFAAIRDIITVRRRAEIEGKVDAIPGVAIAEGEMLFSYDVIRNWTNSRPLLIDILRLISYYKMKEATTIVDLALWKTKIEERGGSNDFISREACHVEIPGPAKDLVMQFLSGKRSY